MLWVHWSRVLHVTNFSAKVNTNLNDKVDIVAILSNYGLIEQSKKFGGHCKLGERLRSKNVIYLKIFMCLAHSLKEFEHMHKRVFKL